jgi:hypothetical protein
MPEELRSHKPFIPLAEVIARLEAVADYRPHTSGEKKYREFVLKRDPLHTLWRIENAQVIQLEDLKVLSQRRQQHRYKLRNRRH